jgi:hypothetical protein
MNGPDDYYLALQKIMGPRAWLATVFGLTALNVALCVGQLSLGHGVAVVLGLGPFVSLLEAAVVCGVAGRRAQAHVRSEKMLMLAGALCCFTFVGTLLATGVAVALWLGNI